MLYKIVLSTEYMETHLLLFCFFVISLYRLIYIFMYIFMFYLPVSVSFEILLLNKHLFKGIILK